MMHRRNRKQNGLGINRDTKARLIAARHRLATVLNRVPDHPSKPLILCTSVAALSWGALGLWAQNPGSVPPPGGKSVTRALGQAPGLESFAVQPKTPVELIEAIDYLVRVGRDDQAVGLAQRLVDAQADTDTLLAIRDRFGTARLLSLQNTPNQRLRKLLEQFAETVSTAAVEGVRDEERINKYIKALNASKEEQDVAREALARSGSQVVSPLINALSAEDATPETRRAIQSAMNGLESSAVPGLVGALRHPDAKVKAAVAEALGEIGDHRALPWLVFASAQPGELGHTAQNAVLKLNDGQSVGSPVRYLTREAASYLDRDVYFSAPNVEVWVWDADLKALQPIALETNVAEGAIGYRLARLALDLDPNDQAAQAIALSTLLQEESDRLGSEFPGKDASGVWSMALASGPQTLENVLKRAMLTGRHERVAILAIKALAQLVTVTDLLTTDGRPHILLEALNSSDRRVQFEAAKALVELDPSERFPGSSRVVPALARFIQSTPQTPRAVVVHNNLAEGSNWVGYLKAAGYDALLETSGRDGFAEAARRGDAELVLVSTQMDPGGWALPETVANFKADARTAGVPLIVVGPLDAKLRLSTLLSKNPGVGFMVSPANQAIAQTQIAFQLKKLGISPLSSTERLAYANEASQLLSRLVAEKGPNAMTAMLGSLDPHVYRTLKAMNAPSDQRPAQSPQARAALFAKVAQDSLREEQRIAAAVELSSEIQKSGYGLPADQVRKINEIFLKLKSDKKPLREALSQLVGVNKPDRATVAAIFQKFAPLAEIYEEIEKSE